MSENRSALLLSVRPRFAEAILSGQKTVEVRRRRVGAPDGALVVLYASSPVMAVVGTARLERIEALGLEDAWETYGHTMGVTRNEFDDYLSGSDVACLLFLVDPSPLGSPLPLNDLRGNRNFHPPQSYRYVAESDPTAIQELTTQYA